MEKEKVVELDIKELDNITYSNLLDALKTDYVFKIKEGLLTIYSSVLTAQLGVKLRTQYTTLIIYKDDLNKENLEIAKRRIKVQFGV